MGTHTQTAEPRVQVTTHITAPCEELPNGFYAARLNANDFAFPVIIDAAKLPNLILDLQGAMLELNAKAMVNAAPAMTAAEGDSFLAELEAETPDKLVTLERPAFSSPMTALIASAGNYRAIWDILSDPDSPTWAELTNEELVSIVRDYWPHRPNQNVQPSRPLEGFSRAELVDAAMFIFVPNYVLGGRGECALGYDDPAAGGEA